MHARELRKAGLLTTGARGVNAPHMTTIDAARLLIALLTTDKPSQAAQSVRDLGRLKPRRKSPGEDREPFVVAVARRLPEVHSFEIGLASLVELFAIDQTTWSARNIHGDFVRRVIVTINPSWLRASIYIPRGGQFYSDRSVRVQMAVRRGATHPVLVRVAEAAKARKERYASRIEVERKLMMEALLDVSEAYATEPYLSQFPPSADYSAFFVQPDEPPLAEAS